jgi:mono/diheme cytochrome c family protein
MRKVIFAAVLLSTAGCNFWYNEVPSPDDLMHEVPWFDHMIVSKAVHPYQRTDIPRETPAGIVPITGAEADWGTGNPLATPIPQYGFDRDYAETVTRPDDLKPVAAARGELMFQRYCAVCHGQAGAGGGITPVAPPLNTATAGGRSDGYLYSYIRYGGPIMPQYGDKIVRLEDRWAVVDYLRTIAPGSPE